MFLVLSKIIFRARVNLFIPDFSEVFSQSVHLRSGQFLVAQKKDVGILVDVGFDRGGYTLSEYFSDFHDVTTLADGPIVVATKRLLIKFPFTAAGLA